MLRWPEMSTLLERLVAQSSSVSTARLRLQSCKPSENRTVVLTVEVKHDHGGAELCYTVAGTVLVVTSEAPATREGFALWARAQAAISSLATALEVGIPLWFIDHGYTTRGAQKEPCRAHGEWP